MAGTKDLIARACIVCLCFMTTVQWSDAQVATIDRVVGTMMAGSTRRGCIHQNQKRGSSWPMTPQEFHSLAFYTSVPTGCYHWQPRRVPRWSSWPS